MNKWVLGLLAILIILAATNPSRADFNDWAVRYSAHKIDEQARRPRQIDDAEVPERVAVGAFGVCRRPELGARQVAWIEQRHRGAERSLQHERDFGGGAAGEFELVHLHMALERRVQAQSSRRQRTV